MQEWQISREELHDWGNGLVQYNDADGLLNNLQKKSQ